MSSVESDFLPRLGPDCDSWTGTSCRHHDVPSTTEYYRILQSTTEYSRVLQETKEYNRVMQSTTEYHSTGVWAH